MTDKVQVMDIADSDDFKTELNALKERVTLLEVAVKELVTAQHEQAISLFESIGSTITDLGQRYRDTVYKTEAPEITILSVPDESEENQQTFWIRLILDPDTGALQGQAGMVVDGEFVVHNCDKAFSDRIVDWLVERNVELNELRKVNIFVEKN